MCDMLGKNAHKEYILKQVFNLVFIASQQIIPLLFFSYREGFKLSFCKNKYIFSSSSSQYAHHFSHRCWCVFAIQPFIKTATEYHDFKNNV